MNNKRIHHNLSAAVNELIPSGEYEIITAKIDSAKNQEKAGINMTAKKSNGKIISYKKIIGTAVAACVALVIGLFGYNYYSTNYAVASIVDIDVNPSVELTANSKDKVLDVTAVNEDGKAILGDMDLKGTDIEVAVNAVVGAMVKGGYFDGQENEILISVQNDDKKHAETLKNKISDNVGTSLEAHKVSSAIINQTIEKGDKLSDAEKFAEEQGVSIGKANFILNLVKKDSSLKAEDLAKLSLKEIAEIVNTKKIDISDIAEVDPEDSIWENIADTVEDVNEQAEEKTDSSAPSNNGVITKNKAREIALRDAGLSESEVIFVEEKLESEKGKKVYEIEFYSEGTEYDYEINANTGKIISSDLDIEDFKIPSSKPQNNSDSSKKENNSSKTISKDKAEKAALKHAGVKASDARFDRTELDNDDGNLHYEIEFYANGYDYDYEVDAKSGAIISFDKEKDDDYVDSGKASNSNSSKITKSEAKKLALSHAGVKSADAKFSKTELDYDDGRKYYDVEFKAVGYEYDYEIDAESGAILKSDKEKDDDYVAPSSSSSKISKAKAKKAAFNHAGVKESEVRELSAEYDNDDGKKIYEIEFKSGKYEYSYEIDAISGKVISHEKEIDD